MSIVGIGEDGLDGLCHASRAALDSAEIVFGGPRHLRLAGVGDRGRAWPVPFSIEPVLAQRGRRIAVLASGDPFWYGAGGSLSTHLDPSEWHAFPSASTFSLAASRLGWRLEETHCIGLHAAPFESLLPHLANGLSAICLMRDGAAVLEFAEWLSKRGFGGSDFWVLESLGGPRERITHYAASAAFADQPKSPAAVAIRAKGTGGRQRTSGLPDDSFRHDGQITKRPIRAITLSTLAPRPGELLWDIGAGSGSVAVEWVLAGSPTATAIAMEARADRIENIQANAHAFGVSDRITVVESKAPDGLEGLPPPDAVFIGGGADDPVLSEIWEMIPPGTRLVVNAVTLETEALLARWSAEKGGNLMRIELAEALPLGRFHGWTPARPVVQWSVIR